MDYLDIRINELMPETEKHLLRSSQPLGWFGLTRNLFRGRLGWGVWVIVSTELVLFVAAVWAAMGFFSATEALEALHYGLSAAVLLIVAVQLDLSLMPQLQTERVLRALKRVEIILLARSAGK